MDFELNVFSSSFEPACHQPSAVHPELHEPHHLLLHVEQVPTEHAHCLSMPKSLLRPPGVATRVGRWRQASNQRRYIPLHGEPINLLARRRQTEQKRHLHLDCLGMLTALTRGGVISCGRSRGVAVEENGRGYRVRGRGQYSWAWLQLLFLQSWDTS